MNRVSFAIAKLFRDEKNLAELSDTPQDICEELRDKSVALVGNARSLSQSQLGPLIDQADIIIRINTSPIPDIKSHGQRTTWIATSTPLTPEVITARSPQRVLWMTSKRKRLPWSLACRAGFYLHPVGQHHKLIAEMGCRPTTGVLVLDMLRRAPVHAVTIFGFDFFASLSLSGARTATQVPHDFATEKKWVDQLYSADNRFTLMKPKF